MIILSTYRDCDVFSGGRLDRKNQGAVLPEAHGDIFFFLLIFAVERDEPP